MKKDRNSFFSQYGVSAVNTSPMMYPQMPQMAPQLPQQQPMNTYMTNNAYMGNQEQNMPDYEARISKLEREIQRLDARVSKLESATNTNVNNNNDYNFANSMYMV